MGKYDHLLSPIKVGNHIFRNRLIMTPTGASLHQEDENYPAEALFGHYLARARNGAALIALSGLYEFNEENPKPHSMRDYFSFDLEKGDNHYLSQLLEGIHGYGAYATIQLQHIHPKDWDISAGAPPFGACFLDDIRPAGHTMTPYELQASTEDMVKMAVLLKQIGFDGVFMHMSYQFTLLGRSLSPTTNLRNDEYGGSFENRLRLLRETCEAIKDACGRDFIIEGHITGEERDMLTGELVPGGWSAEDSKHLAEAMSGLLDILHLRGWNVDAQHPSWICPDEPPYLYLAEKCKEAVTETKILTTAGHKNPEAMEAVIAEGKADFVGIARSVIADPDFIEKLYEDRADDIVPCIRCNRCFEHGPDGTTPRTDRCSVNPYWGFEHHLERMFPPARRKLKIAVAGGGPAGMEAALVARERGHEVTLFEKADKLGGQLNIADFTQDKWALREYRDFLAYQVGKQGVDVRLGTALTPDMVEGAGYDVVVAALGSTPKVPAIPGVDTENVFTILDVYGREEELGRKVVVVGGGSSAIETGMHLVEECGRRVVVLGRNKLLGPDMPPLHYRGVIEEKMAALEGFDGRTQCTVVAIEDGGVRYVDAGGAEHFELADSVVLGIGMQPRIDEALKLACGGARLVTVGDNRQPGNIMDIIRDAAFAVGQL